MSKNKFSIKPLLPEIISSEDAKDFILGAEKNLIDSLSLKEMPWDNARYDVIRLVNVRMTEEYFIKLDYISKKQITSKNKFCLKAIMDEIDRQLALLS